MLKHFTSRRKKGCIDVTKIVFIFVDKAASFLQSGCQIDVGEAMYAKFQIDSPMLLWAIANVRQESLFAPHPLRGLLPK